MPAKQSPALATDNIQSRPPIIVILGHVDHGKTTLLDAIRQTNIAAREHGGITQSIGAYQINYQEPNSKSQVRTITFIDTPGHEAFTKMRSRGATVADIAILVVAANDSVMPQTVESLAIIRQANLPFVVAINKIDLPEANVDRVIKDFLRHNVLLEKYGGEIPWVSLSAKTKQGVDELLETILLVYDLSPAPFRPNGPLAATVIESRLDKNRGPVASAIITEGQIAPGQIAFVHDQKFKVRAILDQNQKPLTAAGPAIPVLVLGFTTVPAVGSLITALPAATTTAASPSSHHPGAAPDQGKLNLILKADSAGSLEAILGLLPEKIHLIESGLGDVSEADVLLAKTTQSIILGFNVAVPVSASKLAESEKVFTHTYRVIYELLDELKDVAEGVATLKKEAVLGEGVVLAEFPFDKLKIAGVKISQGRLARADSVKVLRSEEVIGSARIRSLRIGKEDVTKAEAGKECGVLLDPQIAFFPGDRIQAIQ